MKPITTFAVLGLALGAWHLTDALIPVQPEQVQLAFSAGLGRSAGNALGNARDRSQDGQSNSNQRWGGPGSDAPKVPFDRQLHERWRNMQEFKRLHDQFGSSSGRTGSSQTGGSNDPDKASGRNGGRGQKW